MFLVQFIYDLPHTRTFRLCGVNSITYVYYLLYMYTIYFSDWNNNIKFVLILWNSKTHTNLH